MLDFIKQSAAVYPSHTYSVQLVHGAVCRHPTAQLALPSASLRPSGQGLKYEQTEDGDRKLPLGGLTGLHRWCER